MCTKLQNESAAFALQNPWFCDPKCSILQPKTMHFAPQSRFRETAISTVRKSGKNVTVFQNTDILAYNRHFENEKKRPPRIVRSGLLLISALYFSIFPSFHISIFAHPVEHLLHHRVAFVGPFHCFEGEAEHHGAPVVGAVAAIHYAGGQVVLAVT